MTRTRKLLLSVPAFVVLAVPLLACIQPQEPSNALDHLTTADLGVGLTTIAWGEQTDTWTSSGSVVATSRENELEVYGERMGSGVVTSELSGASRNMQVVSVEGLQLLPSPAVHTLQGPSSGSLGVLLVDAVHQLPVRYLDGDGNQLAGGGLPLAAERADRFAQDPYGHDLVQFTPGMLGEGRLQLEASTMGGVVTTSVEYEVVGRSDIELELRERDGSRSWGVVSMELGASTLRGDIPIAVPTDELGWTIDGRRVDVPVVRVEDLPARVCVDFRDELFCDDLR